jgi:hypothetical protein
VGAWQLDPGQSGQAALYLFTPTRYSMVLAATDRPDIADMSKATADELRAIWGPLLATFWRKNRFREKAPGAG